MAPRPECYNRAASAQKPVGDMGRRRQEEVEVKIRLSDPAAVERRLRRAGFHLLSRELEQDVLLDTAARFLSGRQCLLRLRRHGRNWLLTYKGPPANDARYKAREEIETVIQDGGPLRTIFERLGFREVFVYEKRRRTFQRPREPGLVAVDHTPIGDYMELEGPRAWIDRTARTLGYAPADYRKESYRQLYVEYCRQRGLEPSHMTFSRQAK